MDFVNILYTPELEFEGFEYAAPLDPASPHSSFAADQSRETTWLGLTLPKWVQRGDAHEGYIAKKLVAQLRSENKLERSLSALLHPYILQRHACIGKETCWCNYLIHVGDKLL